MLYGGGYRSFNALLLLIVEGSVLDALGDLGDLIAVGFLLLEPLDFLLGLFDVLMQSY